MPVLAPPLADVVVRDERPLVAFGLEHHLLDPAAIALLHGGALVELSAVTLEALGEVIAHPLELGERARSDARRAHAPLEALTEEGGGEQVGRLALEARDLLPQGDPRGALVRLDDRWKRRREGARHRTSEVSVAMVLRRMVE